MIHTKKALAAEGAVPTHEHDCESCVFLGSVTRHEWSDDGEVKRSTLTDWYYHLTPYGVTLVGRRSADGPDYSSLTFSIGEYTMTPYEGMDWALQIAFATLGKELLKAKEASDA